GSSIQIRAIRSNNDSALTGRQGVPKSPVHPHTQVISGLHRGSVFTRAKNNLTLVQIVFINIIGKIKTTWKTSLTYYLDRVIAQFPVNTHSLFIPHTMLQPGLDVTFLKVFEKNDYFSSIHRRSFFRWICR